MHAGDGLLEGRLLGLGRARHGDVGGALEEAGALGASGSHTLAARPDPPPVSLADANSSRPSINCTYRATMARPRALAQALALVALRPALLQLLRQRGIHAGAVVVHAQHAKAGLGMQCHGDAGRRAAPVAQCVVQQVVQDAFHQRDVAPHHHGLVQALGAQVHPQRIGAGQVAQQHVAHQGVQGQGLQR